MTHNLSRSPAAAPRPGQDHQPGIRTLLAAKLLRAGCDPEDVAVRTGVPLPLVHLIRDEIDAASRPT